MRRDTTTLNQNRSGHVWNPKYDKAHEAMPKVGYYQIAWSGLIATHRSYDRTTAEHNSNKHPMLVINLHSIYIIIDEVCPLEAANLIGPARLLF